MMSTLNSAKFVFAGNRFHVLDEMLKRGLNVVQIFATKNSYLEKELTGRALPYLLIEGKSDFIEYIDKLDFDFFVSNGLPIILPINRLSANKLKSFINIHPSYLPDLRGSDPVPGAILHQRDSGVTCHYMNEKIDAGDIISQIKIPFNSFLDSVTLHQLSFSLERQVFIEAFKLDFRVQKVQGITSNCIYYSFKEEDLRISFDEEPSKIVARIKAFNNKSKGAYFIHQGEIIKVFDVEQCDDENLYQLFGGKDLLEKTVLVVAERQILVSVNQQILKLKDLAGNLSVISKSDKLL